MELFSIKIRRTFQLVSTLVIELVEKNGGRHQTIRVENSDVVAAKVINELKIK